MPRETSSWARKIKSYQEIPDEFREIFVSFSSDQQQFPYTIYAPSHKWGLRKRTNSKLISMTDHKIFYAEKTNNEIIVKEFLLGNINYIEHGAILLYSWIKIAGIINHDLSTATIEFNTVVETLFMHIIQHARMNINNFVVSDVNNELYARETDKFDCLLKIDFKLMNYSRSSLIRGQIVNRFVYQPIISKKYLAIIYHIKIFPKILILTGNELIIIKDEEVQAGGSYGGIKFYIPLHRIVELVVNPAPKTRFNILTIGILGGDSIRLKFSSVEDELEQLINEFYKIKRERGKD